MDPLRAADELGDVAPRPGQRFGNLHAAGAAADDAPALARIRHAVIPARRVEGWAGETLATRNIGKKRPVEKAGGADEHVCNIRVSPSGFDLPATVRVPRRDDLLVEADEVGETGVARDLLDWVPSLGRERRFA